MRRPASLVALAFVAWLLSPAAQPQATAAGGPPKIRSVSPTAGLRGSTADVTIEGSNLFPVEEVTASAADVSVVVQPGSSEHHLVLRLTIPESAPPGPLTIKVRTKDGSDSSSRFQVRLRAPVVSKVVPESVRRGAAYELSLSGSNLAFAGAETAVTTDAPMTATRLPKSTDRLLVVKLVVPPETPPGPHPVTVETSVGKFTASFLVLLSPPAIAGIEPAAVVRGGEAVLTLKGQNLAGASVVLAGPDENLTVTAGGEATATAVPCASRPGRAPCPGRASSCWRPRTDLRPRRSRSRRRRPAGWSSRPRAPCAGSRWTSSRGATRSPRTRSCASCRQTPPCASSGRPRER